MSSFRLAVLTITLFLGTMAQAADTLPIGINQVVTPTTLAAPVQQTFSVSPGQDLVLTLSDLGLNTPYALVSAGVVVAQANMTVASAQLSASTPTASISIPNASGFYTLYLYGVPAGPAQVPAGPGFGAAMVCVAPKANPSNCIQGGSLTAVITAPSVSTDPTASNLTVPLTVTVQDSYTFTFKDLQYPAALNAAPAATLIQGHMLVAQGITSGTAVTLSPGIYQLLVSAQADKNIQAGLYATTATGALSGTLLPNTVTPVGLMKPAQVFNNPTPQSLTLAVTDYGFPAPLGSASALLTARGAIVGTASAAGGSQKFNAPAGPIDLWTFGTVGVDPVTQIPTSPGAFSAGVSAGNTDLATSAQGVGPVGGTYVYAFAPTSLAAGAYTATVTDFQFPAVLYSLSLAVAQNGTIVQRLIPPSGSVNFNAASGTAILLVSAQPSCIVTPQYPQQPPPCMGAPPTNTNSGLFDINLQSAGQTVFDQNQSVNTSPGAQFFSQPLTLGTAQGVTASLADLKVPVAFGTVALAVTQNSTLLGKIYGSGSFSFAATGSTYQLTFFTSLTATQPFGIYSGSITSAPTPTVQLTANPTSATTGASVQLNWTVTNATSCTASGGGWSGSKLPSSGAESVVLSTTTTYTLTCTGPGGTTPQSVSVTATTPPPPPPKSSAGGGGGGSLDWTWLIVGTTLSLAARYGRTPVARARD